MQRSEQRAYISVNMLLFDVYEQALDTMGRQCDPVKKGGKGTVCHNASNVLGAPQMTCFIRTSLTEL